MTISDYKALGITKMGKP